MGGKLTARQLAFLRVLAEHGRLSVGSHPPVQTLLSAGCIEWVQRPGSGVVAITPAGRAALSEGERG